MVIERSLPFIENYLSQVNAELKKVHPGYELSYLQQRWLGFCLSAILLTNSICWKRFERASLGRYKNTALSWMFRHSKVYFLTLFEMSIEQILHNYGIVNGVICIDDVDRSRSKNTCKLHKVHKLKDKLTGGYCDGQSLVFLFLVTPVASFPIGFEFYSPDPQWSAWKKEDQRLKQKKVPKSERPLEPDKNPDYPSKWEIALQLLTQFQQRFSRIHIKCVLADGLYGNTRFVDSIRACYPKAQVVTKMKCNQHVRFKGKDIAVSQYFQYSSPVLQEVTCRQKDSMEIYVASARLYVPSHGKKRLVIALRYPNETQCRYLLASDLSWRTTDIIHAYSFRWLIEVFFEDWKGHEGWGKLTKHQGEEGSWKTVILSLLLDHALLFHPDQKAQLENKLPAYTVASLSQRIQNEALLQFVQDLSSGGVDENKIQKLKIAIDIVIPLKTSKKHMSSVGLPELKSAPSLRRWKQTA